MTITYFSHMENCQNMFSLCVLASFSVPAQSLGSSCLYVTSAVDQHQYVTVTYFICFHDFVRFMFTLCVEVIFSLLIRTKVLVLGL